MRANSVINLSDASLLVEISWQKWWLLTIWGTFMFSANKFTAGCSVSRIWAYTCLEKGWLHIQDILVEDFFKSNLSFVLWILHFRKVSVFYPLGNLFNFVPQPSYADQTLWQT